jgi:hypothetical protein
MRKSTKYLAAVAAIAIGSASPFMVAVAQTMQKSPARLADVMSAVQFRHSKLWTAGQQKNWELAGYELELVKTSLNEAIAFYTDIPVDNITMIDPPIKSIESAIAARNSAAFGKAFGELTMGCNSCHQSTGRGFIVMTVPTASPFGNQSFAPRPGQGKESPRR